MTGERLSLGQVRSAPRRYDPLPAGGPGRDEALDRLRAVIAADVARTIDAAIAAGWDALDHEAIADGCVRWWREFVLEAIADGLYDWRHSQ